MSQLQLSADIFSELINSEIAHTGWCRNVPLLISYHKVSIIGKSELLERHFKTDRHIHKDFDNIVCYTTLLIYEVSFWLLNHVNRRSQQKGSHIYYK